jgi:RNA polymerase sigma factor (TIGR02999 family)
MRRRSLRRVGAFPYHRKKEPRQTAARVLNPAEQNVTALLQDLQQGVPGAADRLVPLVYAELHRIAEAAMRRESPGHTLQPTLLVDEAFMRMIGQERSPWQNRAQFFALAAQTIRRILVDHARARRRLKRDHGLRVTLSEDVAEAPDRSLDLLTLDDALSQLEALSPRQARVVEMRYFAGLEIEETAQALGVAPATVKRDWTFARAFLLRALEPQSP